MNDFKSIVIFDDETNEVKDSRPIFSLARVFLSISTMSNKKLQKLCYYAKAWYLALYDENIIPESFEAWVHGAVQPELYQKYKIYGFMNIPTIEHSELTDEEINKYQSFAEEIYKAYGHLTGDQLEALNHTEEPWLVARKGIPSWQNSSNIIDENVMKEFYRSKMQI